ncbi:MAG: chitobiase/beta-hexosaminidase C-terminal domain-containing protein [Muribaculaceae bacterium]|nr:chitobiase/beta-hexosaminidase C-terminal domain-containing protein [Muribaculaceae bacterium]
MKKFLLSIMCLCTMLFAFADTYDSGVFGQTTGNGGTGTVWTDWGDADLNGVTWNASGEFQTDPYFGHDANNSKGTQFGSSKKPAKTVTIKTGEIPGIITSVKVNTCGASSVVADLAVTVGGVQYGEKVALTQTATDYTFEGTASGEIALNYTVEQKAVYLKQIVVEYTPVQKNVAAPTSTLAEGTYTDVQTVELACETEGATIYYTLDGNDPTKESTEYTGAFQIAKNCTLKAIAYNGEDDSNVASFNYTFALPTPVFEVAGGVYTEAFSCAITCTDAEGNEFSNTKLYYTLDGTDPTSESDRLWGAHYVSETCNVKAVAVRTVTVGEESIEICSPVASESYIIANLAYYKKATEIADGKYLMSADGYGVAEPLQDGYTYGYLYVTEAPANENGVICTADYYELTFASVEGGYTIQDSKGRYLSQGEGRKNFNVSTDRQTAVTFGQ